MESRQVRRRLEQLAIKLNSPMYPLHAQRGGPSVSLIHRNRRHREDGRDYFPYRA